MQAVVVSIFMLADTVSAAKEVQYEDVVVGGYACGESQNARVYYSVGSEKLPLVVFAHGYNNPGSKAYDCYSTMNSDLAAAGYVVIVPESSSFPFECSRQWEDQIRSIEWAKTSSISNRIDFSSVGLMGHSMGGGATYHAAGQASVVKANNIAAVVALHPQIASLQPTTDSAIPIFFGSGSSDDVVSPSSVKAAYTQTSGVPKVFAEIAGASHYEPENNCDGWTSPGHQRFTPYVIAMFDCHLLGSSGQCSKVYGKGRDSLCSGSVKMSDCEVANAPEFAPVLI